ncbi:NAD(P)-binding protein [Rhizophagus irregularis]|uniref:NAD(P)-binding protein n=1 Tax=Rhizophagus irregularis TaxID=588596 RepID=A0A2I1FT24_9GLOM|nr:NAD(P)-binding protein [Rhizophagus irregularis]
MLHIIFFLIISLLIIKFFFLCNVPSLSKLQGKNVIITGASTGIGEEMAYICAKNGANIVIASRRTDLLEKVASKCKNISPNRPIKIITCDLKHEKDCEKLINLSVEFFNEIDNKPEIDMLILNHAMSLFEHMDFNNPKLMIEKLRDITMSNLIGFATLSHLTIPYMISNSSKREFKSIIVLSSLMSTISLGMSWAYSTSKAAINSYFSSLNEELEYQEFQNQIKITLCQLGSINTITMRSHTDKYFPKLLVDYIALNAEVTAKIILQSGLNGQKELWYPSYGILLRYAYGIFPGIMRKIGFCIQKYLIKK